MDETDIGQSWRRFADAVEAFRLQVFADNPGLDQEAWTTGRPWLDVAVEREKRRGGESE